jgi:hypothetical protein
VLTKAQLLDAISDELRVCRHLARKLPQGGLDWRPTPGQRSTLELLRYLSTAGTDLTREMASGTWDVARVTGRAPQDLRAEDFDAAMERQDRDIRALLAPYGDADLRTRPAMLPTGQPSTLGTALVLVVWRALVGYRMQLFLYAKGAGNAALTTLDCWYGIDAPRR